MKLHNSIFEIIRQTSNVPEDEINTLEKKANDETRLYSSEDKGIKGLYAKIHKGWIMQTVIMLAMPLIIAKYLNYKNSVLSSPFDDLEDDQDEINNKLDLDKFI